MTDSNIISFNASSTADVLNELLKQGARELLTKAIEAEVSELLDRYHHLTAEGKQVVVRNGHLPERTIQTGLGDIPVKVPKVRDRFGQGIKINSQLVPPYLKRSKHLDEFIPWLYLKGISTGDMQPALEALQGEGATGLSANTVSRLKQTWEQDYEHWRKQDLSHRRYVYIWADGVYCNVLNKVPKAMQPKIKDALHDIWIAETKQAAEPHWLVVSIAMKPTIRAR